MTAVDAWRKVRDALPGRNLADVQSAARCGQAPDGWVACGGADWDMVGVLWEDTAGHVYLGVAEPTEAQIPDPCTWYRPPSREVAS